MKLYLNVSILLLLMLTLLFLFSISGCNRKNQDKKEKKVQSVEQVDEKKVLLAVTEAPPTNVAPADSDISQVATEKIALKQTDTSNSSIVPPIQQTTGRNNTLLAKISEKAVTPEDFEIGSLFNSNENNESELFIIQFFENMENGKFDSLKINEENRFFLERVFDVYIVAGQVPDYVRVGVAVKEEDSVSTRFNLRLYKGINRTEGEISLTGSGESLQIKDFYGDLSLLDVEYDNADKKYEPEIYSFR